ncbi:MAG: acyltransferase family protein [Paraprevotella sp.]|nr:acyltransferase family protein [Paraprevotella sp.]MBP3471296.1 acyltransferase family protein [Paraprevotella sp.]
MDSIVSQNKLSSQALDLLRFPLAIIVLLIHVFSSQGLVIHGTQLDLNQYPILQFVNRVIDGFLRGQSVPVYFFISGYVFFREGNLTKEIYRRKLSNRFHSLFIPYILWNMLALFWLLFKMLPLFASLLPGLQESSIHVSLHSFLMCFWDRTQGIIQVQAWLTDKSSVEIYPMDVPLWFLRDLMIVILTTPLLYLLIKRLKYVTIVILGVSWFITDSFVKGYANQLLIAFFFFSWGAYMSICRKDMLVELGRFFSLSMILYPLLSMTYVYMAYVHPELCPWIKRVNILVGLFFAYNMASFLLRKSVCKSNRFLSAASFFIYVSHTLICMEVLKSVFLLFSPSSDLGLLGVYIVAVVITIGSLLYLFYFLSGKFPRFLKVLAGRKG